MPLICVSSNAINSFFNLYFNLKFNQVILFNSFFNLYFNLKFNQVILLILMVDVFSENFMIFLNSLYIRSNDNKMNESRITMIG
jgi:hypothetical protein